MRSPRRSPPAAGTACRQVRGPRENGWALALAGPGAHLLIRRSVSSGELAYYRSWSPRTVTLADLVRVAGARWAVEECFQAAKNETALDHYQARMHAPGTGTSPWPCAPTPGSLSARPRAARHKSRIPAAGLVLATGPERGPAACGQLSRPAAGIRNLPVTGSDGREMIRLSVNEILRMHAILSRPAHPVSHYLRWSAWRRQHQARARHCHYQRRRERDN